MKTALIIGSTGLIGSQLLQLLLKSPDYKEIITFVKRDIQFTHPKLTQHIIDFDKPATYEQLVKGDDFFCTIGTTIKKAGSKEEFKKVDYNYPQQFAIFGLQNKIKQFLLISSIEADFNSGNFYLKTKGEIESFLKNSTLENISILRPSLLLGNRKEFRIAEKIGSFFMRNLSFLLIGNLKKYKAIEGATVAQALYNIAQQNNSGYVVYESDSIQEIGT